jgi:hypothetical protein
MYPFAPVSNIFKLVVFLKIRRTSEKIKPYRGINVTLSFIVFGYCNNTVLKLFFKKQYLHALKTG